ncbi:MAG: polyprenol phosphomannose-dependent alpha 1,6 mannosyltransferase MptB [Sciscionella sp.]
MVTGRQLATQALPSFGAREPAARLNAGENSQLVLIRRFGLFGSLLLAVGSLGAGAAPVFNPVASLPLIGLFARMPIVAIACAFIGMAMIVLAWLWLGRLCRPRRIRLASVRELKRILLVWALPLAFVPPLFSRDVYSYLAQSKIAALGLNPYVLGPARALGNSDLLTQNVPNVWRDTPAPYGPLFITLGRGITAIAGDHVVLSILLQRVLELLGLALIVWALPRLAARWGVQPVSALWLGALNPLVLFHLVAGVHNEALMIGLMLAGLEIALRHVPIVGAPDHPPPLTRHEVGHLLLGAAVISLGAAVKISALPALGFFGVFLARRLGNSWRVLGLVAVALTAVAALVLTVFSIGTGLGFGWISALGTNGLVRSLYSPTTLLAYLVTGVGLVAGLGNHVDSAVAIVRVICGASSVVLSVKLLLECRKGRFTPMVGLGLCLAVVVLLGATVQPWYLLWAAIPLAAGVGHSAFRTVAAGLSAVGALLIPPTGSAFDGRSFVLPQAYLGTAIVLVLLLLLVRRRLPVFRIRVPAAESEPRDSEPAGPTPAHSA